MVIIVAVIAVLVGMWKETRDAKCSFMFHQLHSLKKGMFTYDDIPYILKEKHYNIFL
ncbi:unnamed protein product [Brassica rapa subsp. trilocularis]